MEQRLEFMAGQFANMRNYAACRIVALAVMLALLGLSSTALGIVRPAKSGSVIACYHPKIKQFSAQAHPSRCNIAGYRGGQFVEIPIQGMNWVHWGFNPTLAARGRDRRNGDAVRLTAYRPIRCSDGRTWYSRVTVVPIPSGNWFELRLKSCDRLRP